MNHSLIVITVNTQANAIEAALAALLTQLPGVEILAVPGLYYLPETSPVWARLAACDGTLVVVSRLHPRPVEWLLTARDVKPPRLLAINSSEFVNPEACFTAIAEALEVSPLEDSVSPLQTLDEETALRWYPVMDKSRCTDCGHCRQFCLFGVYSTDEVGHVAVTNLDLCKPGCPACARICPQSAIIFPLYTKDAAIAGAPGQFVTLDFEARRMYYRRTKLACPVCGSDAPHAATLGDDLCPECGRPRQTAEPDDLDALIDAVDNLVRRKT